MNTRPRLKSSDRTRGTPDELSLYVALVLVAIAAVGLACLALSGVHIGSPLATAPVPDSPPSSAKETSVTPTSTPRPAVISVGFVGETSSEWWGASLEAGLVDGASAGPKVGQNGDDIAAITGRLDQVVFSRGQPVVIQVGSQDIIRGASASEIDASMKALWQNIRDRGGQPIASLIPPSNVFPGSVTTVNAQIRASAQAEGVAVLDVTSSVGAADGTWSAGFSDDGQQPNASGTTAMVQEAVSQLPDLIGSAALTPLQVVGG
jgi:lysophospholipase L1-like esterase